MTVLTRASGLVAFFLLLAASAQADTIYMKNGSVIRGTVVDYADGRFTVMLNMGGSGAQSRATLVGSEIDRIEFDATGPGGAGPGAVSSGDVSAADPAPRYEPPAADPEPVASADDPGDSGAGLPPPVEDDGAGAEPPPAGDPAGRATEVSIPAKNDWTSTQVRLRRGDRVRINATGTVQLDRTGKLTVTPVGSNIPDRNKLLTNRPTGALIAVVGDDNDDFIFVGSGTEFTAARDGLLFLSVNEGELADNSGAFTARVSVNGGQPLTSSTRDAGGVTTRPAAQPRREGPAPSEPPLDPEPEPSDTSAPPPVADAGTEPAPEVPAATPTNAAVREANVVVSAKNDWTSTQIRVQAGARIRISASGTVQLDRAGTRTSTPAGVDIPDPTKLITNRPTGGLIAVIGDDNDDFIFVGSETEFVAQREGLLFLSVNEGELSDNSGNYSVRLTVEQPRSVASR